MAHDEERTPIDDDRITITFYNTGNEDSSSAATIIRGFDSICLCRNNHELEITEHELYDMIKWFLDNYDF